MIHSEQSPKTIHADPEHGGIRFVVILILILGLILGFFLIQLLLNLLAPNSILIEFATVLSCSGAVVVALAVAWVSEIYLKRIWHSGIMLLLGDSELGYQVGSSDDEEEGSEKIVFDWSKNVNLTRWYFELSGYARVGREKRVSDKWLCLACQIQQDANAIITFGYFPPDEATSWTENRQLSESFKSISLAHLYTEVGMKKRDASTRPSIPSSMLTGSDGRYWLVEQKRWKEGIELTKEDFADLMAYTEQKINV